MRIREVVCGTEPLDDDEVVVECESDGYELKYTIKIDTYDDNFTEELQRKLVGSLKEFVLSSQREYARGNKEF